MNITIQQHELGTAAVFIVSGPLTVEGSAGAVQDAVVGAVEQGRKQILIDLRAVSYMDSAGLGELIGSYARGAKVGASVRVQNAPARVLELLRITQLRDVLVR